MRITIRTKKPEAIARLALCIAPTIRAFHSLRAVFGMKLPAELILRPVRENKEALKRSLTFGRGGIGADGKYYVAINTRCYSTLSESCLDTIAHEAAHVAELLLYNRLTHGKKFDEMYKVAKGALAQRAVRHGRAGFRSDRKTGVSLSLPVCWYNAGKGIPGCLFITATGA
ncbi:MAG: hypothetical protein IT388_01420 [Nitrospirales bacterium]|nr:hypothetical protein [Nitrospirales bacterium]